MSWWRREGDGHKDVSFEGNRWRTSNHRADKLTSGNILKTSAVIGRIPLVSTSYRSLVPAGVFLLVVNRNDGALQHRDRDILQADGEEETRRQENHQSSWTSLQVFESYLKLLVSSLFCSHLQTCRFLHLSNRSEFFTLESTQRGSEREEEEHVLAGGVLRCLSAPLTALGQHYLSPNSRP